MESSVSVQSVSTSDVACPECGGLHLRRLPRQGFWQQKLYAYFGYFPWECPICRKTMMLKHRGKKRRRTAE